MHQTRTVRRLRLKASPTHCLCMSALALCASLALPAQASQSFVVIASREPLAPERVAADVVVIDRSAIENSTADSLADLLRREAGVQLSRNGGPGQSSGALLRGAAAVNTVVLVDGVRVGSATLGFAQLEALSLSQVERIEVLRGPASSLVGADAVGGVVQVFTRRTQSAPGFQAHAAAGGYGAREASLSAQGRWGALEISASGSRESSGGVSAVRPGDLWGTYNPDADGHSLRSAQWRLGWQAAPGHRLAVHGLRSRLNAQYDASEFLPPTWTADSTPDFRNRLRTEAAGAQWSGRLPGATSGSVSLTRSVDDLLSGGTQTDRFRTVREQQSAQWRAPWGASGTSGASGAFVLALEGLQEKASSTSYLQEVSRRGTAVALAWTGAVERLSWQADMRRDDRSDFGRVTTGRLGGAFSLGLGWRARALAGTTFRAPSFNDLVFPGYGVPGLRPEQGRSAEAGVHWEAREAQAALTVYRNRVRDLIGYQPDPTGCPPDPAYTFGCAGNTQRATLQGASLSGQRRIGEWNWRVNAEFLDARDDITGARLNRRAAHQATLSAQWRRGPWSAGAQVLRLGKRPDAGLVLPAETTLDLQAGWAFAPRWALQARVLNATDRDLQPARDYQGLGRQAWLMLRYGGVEP